MIKDKVKVIEVRFGDWGENWMCEKEWEYFNEWYGIKEKIDDMMSGLLWNSVVCKNGEVVDIMEVMEGVRVKKYGDYVMEIGGEEYDEFSFMYFNVEKLRGKIIELDEDGKGFKIMDDDKDVDVEWENLYMNGDYDDDMEEIIVSCGNKYKVSDDWDDEYVE